MVYSQEKKKIFRYFLTTDQNIRGDIIIEKYDRIRKKRRENMGQEAGQNGFEGVSRKEQGIFKQMSQFQKEKCIQGSQEKVISKIC